MDEEDQAKLYENIWISLERKRSWATRWAGLTGFSVKKKTHTSWTY